jgi:hypothetical protein
MEDARIIACSCHTVTSLDEQGRVEKHRKLPHKIQGFTPKWLKPGAQVTYNGEDFTLKSVFSFTTKWNEWDSEDNCWENGTSATREYYFQSTKENELCLIYEDGYFYIREEVKRLDDYTKSRFYEEKNYDIIEHGTYQITAFLGEDDEPLFDLECAYKVMADLNGDLTGEGSATDFQHKKVRFYRKTLLKKAELEGLHAKFNPEYSSLVAERSTYDFWRKVAGIPALIFFALWANTYLADTKDIAQGIANFNIFANVTEKSGTPKSLFTANLSAEQNYILHTNCYFEETQGEVEYALQVLKKPENKLVNAINCTFYIESGYDSDGSWAEFVVTDDFQFHVPETAEYEFIATPMQGFDANDLNYNKNSTSGRFIVDIKETKVSRWYGLMFLLSFFVWLIAQWNYENLGVRIGLPIKSFLNEVF